MAKEKFLTRFNRGNVAGMKFLKPSCTKQSFQYEVNINTIAERMQRGVYNSSLPVNTSKPVFDDFSNLDYQHALNVVCEAKSRFEELPATVRQRFNNNPAELLKFVENKSENYEEGLKLGIFEKVKEIKPIDVNIVTPQLPQNPETGQVVGDSGNLATS